MHKIILIIILIFFSQTAFAQIKTHPFQKGKKPIEIAQWEVHDIIFQVKKEVENPFTKEIYAVVQDKESSQNIPLFYNGNNTWVLRYSSSTTGSKSFTLTGDIPQLASKTGAFHISANQKEDRHGAVVLNTKDQQHLYYEDGKHYFNLAFECDWLYALDYGKKELQKTHHLLSLIKKNGFNQVVMNVYAHDVQWVKDKKLAQHPEHEYGGRQDMFPFLGSNTDPDYSSLNVDFFQHFDRVIAAMHDKEIVSHMMIYVWNKKVAWPDMNSEADNLYYDYVIKRYQAFPNMIWDVSKEALYYGRATNEYISERIQRARKLDAFDRLVSVHDFGFCRNHPDEVDFISTQDWTFSLYHQMQQVKREFPNKAILNIEHGGYETSPYKVFPGAYTDAEACLRRNYMCLFAGTYTTYYWQGTSWNVVIHNPYEQPESSYKPHFEYFAHMRKLAEAVPFENFQPNPAHNSFGYNLTNTQDGMIMMYVPKECHSMWVNGQISKQFKSENATQQWFNTLTGEFSEETPYVVAEHDFWSWRPWRMEADAVLIIRNLE